METAAQQIPHRTGFSKTLKLKFFSAVFIKASLTCHSFEK
jgi:hypothetical protein